MVSRFVSILSLLVLLVVWGCSGMGEANDPSPPSTPPSTDTSAEQATVDGYTAQPARIYIDGRGSDWRALSVRHEETGDAEELDIERLWTAHTEQHLFLRLELGQSINLQEDNDLTLYLDADNDPSTGPSALGAELTWRFGDREGTLRGETVEHAKIGLHSLPTVTSDVFEIALNRSALQTEDSLRIALSSDGDRLPDGDKGLGYELTEASTNLETPGIDAPAAADVRILSQNSVNNFDEERSAIFEEDRQPSYRRIIEAVGPDVIAFQEIYSQTAEETEQVVEGTYGRAERWEWAKAGQDLVLGSRYPIVDTHTIPGYEDYESGAFLLDATEALGSRLVVVNMHPPCCNYDANEEHPARNVQRQRVVDGVAAFLRTLKSGDGPFDVAPETPIAVVGDMNFVGKAQQPTTLQTGDIVYNEDFGPSEAPDWDGTALLDTNPRQTGAPMHATWASVESSFPPGRLDYAFVTDSVLKVVHEFVLNTATLSEELRAEYNLQSDDTATASDHMAVVIDVAAK